MSDFWRGYLLYVGLAVTAGACASSALAFCPNYRPGCEGGNERYVNQPRDYPPQGTPVNPYVVITPDGRRLQVQAGPNPHLPQGTDLNPYRIR